MKNEAQPKEKRVIDCIVDPKNDTRTKEERLKSKALSMLISAEEFLRTKARDNLRKSEAHGGRPIAEFPVWAVLDDDMTPEDLADAMRYINENGASPVHISQEERRERIEKEWCALWAT